MASKKQIYVRGVNGVLWWRFWNPMAKLGDWEYCQAPINDPIPDKEWGEMFDGTPIRKLWTQDQNDDGQYVREQCKENYQAEIITDIDDWYDDIPETNPAKAVHKRFHLDKKLSAMHEMADTICCSTPFLVDKMGPRAKLCPNFIVEENWEFPKRTTKRDDECVLMFGAGMGRAGEIHEIREALRTFLKEPNTKIVFIGAWHKFASEFPPGKVIWSRFAEAWDYPQLIRWIAPDITISPMEHRDFNLAKSNIKWLESAMIDACFVGENWGDMARTITDGKDGFLADGIDQWT
ncbi:MAG: hypothetical protein DRQ56_08900, partial [Gammaproteobacteria bacterium]